MKDSMQRSAERLREDWHRFINVRTESFSPPQRGSSCVFCPVGFGGRINAERLVTGILKFTWETRSLAFRFKELVA